jgi:membrane protein required for colicin V production
MIFDAIVLVLVGVSALISFMRGFIREVLTIAGVVGGVLAAIFMGPAFAPLMRGWFGVVEGQPSPEKLFGLIPIEIAADITAYGLIFVAVVIAIYILTQLIAGAAKAVGLGPVDRTLGVVFGMARAILLMGLIYMPLNVLIPQSTKDSLFQDSKTHVMIESTSAWLAGFLPDYDVVKQETEDQFKQKLKDNELLSGSVQKQQTQEAPAQDTLESPEKSQPEKGYQEDQREKLEKLFNEPAMNE